MSSFILNALLISVLVGVLLPIVGSFAFLRKSTFFGAGMAHTAFAGAAMGIALGIEPLLTATLFAIVSAIGIWYLTKSKKLTQDASIGVFFSVSMALGILFLSRTGNYASDAMTYLVGNVLAVTDTDIAAVFAVLLFVIAAVLMFWKELFLSTLSEELAKASGLKVDIISLWTMIIMSVAVVVTLKAVGTLLLFGLLVMPAAAAYQLTRRLASMIVVASLIGVFSGLVGTILSIYLDLPTGPMIVLVAFVLMAIAYRVKR